MLTIIFFFIPDGAVNDSETYLVKENAVSKKRLESLIYFIEIL